MKKKFYLLLFAMLFSFVASAQRFEYQLGLKGGLGFDWVGNVGENVYSTEKGFCYKYGFTGIYYFGENYGVTSGFRVRHGTVHRSAVFFITDPASAANHI